MKKLLSLILSVLLLSAVLPWSCLVSAAAASVAVANGHKPGVVDSFTTFINLDDPTDKGTVTDVVFNGVEYPVDEQRFALSVRDMNILEDEVVVAHFQDSQITGITLLADFRPTLSANVPDITFSHAYDALFSWSKQKIKIEGSVSSKLPTLHWSEADKLALKEAMWLYDIGGLENLTLELRSGDSDKVYFEGAYESFYTEISVADLLTAGNTAAFSADLYVNTKNKPEGERENVTIEYILRAQNKEGILLSGEFAVQLVNTDYEEPLVYVDYSVREILLDMQDALKHYHPKNGKVNTDIALALTYAVNKDDLAKSEGVYEQFENLQVAFDTANMICSAQWGGVAYGVADAYLEKILNDVAKAEESLQNEADRAVQEMFKTEGFQEFFQWYQGESGYQQRLYQKVEDNCPTDIAVYDEKGALALTVIADEVTVYNDAVFAFCADGHKTFYLPTDVDYRVEITATADGKMDYFVSSLTAGGVQRVISYKNVPLTAGGVYNAVVPCEATPPTDAFNLVNEQGTVIQADSDTLPAVESDIADVVVAEDLFGHIPQATIDKTAQAMFNMEEKAELTDGQIALDDAAALFSAIAKHYPVEYSLLVNSDFTYRIVYDAATMQISEIRFDYGGASAEKYKERVSAVQNKLSEIVLQMQGMNDFEKALFAHDYIVLNSTYDTELLAILETEGTLSGECKADRYSEYAILVNGTGICGSYALAYRAILNAAGAECLYLSSSAMNHAWNMVKVDGEWYHVDCCWDDPVPDAKGIARRTHFLRTDSEMMQLAHFSWTPGNNKAASGLYSDMPRLDDNRQKYDYETDTWYYLTADTVYSADRFGSSRTEVLPDINATAVAAENGMLYYAQGRNVFAYDTAAKQQSPAFILPSYDAGMYPQQAYFVNIYVRGEQISYYKNTHEYFAVGDSYEYRPTVSYAEDMLKTQLIASVTGVVLDSVELEMELFSYSSLYAYLESEYNVWEFEIDWSSSDESVVEVDEWGSLQALNMGTAVITASFLDHSACCVVTVVAASGSEPEAELAGSLNADIRWHYDKTDKVLTISGTGPMPDYQHRDYDTTPWYEFNYEIKKIVIENGITAVGDYAFYNCSAAETVTLADSVAQIGMYAFYNCARLDHVVIPEGVKKIDYSTFNYCANLKSITLPATLERIEDSGFWGCGFERFAVPEGVTFIGSNAFANCKKLTQITFPEGLRSIGYSALQYTAITQLLIPASLAEWGLGISTVCWGCYKLEKFIVDPANPHFSNDAEGVLFNKEKTQLIEYPRASKAVSYCVPATVTEIAREAFAFAPNLTQIILPASVNSIGFSAFRNEGNLLHVAYCGTKADFEKINIGYDNDCLKNATYMHFHYSAQDIITAEEIPATCTENGRTQSTYCSVCDCYLSGEVIPAMKHNYEKSDHFAGTCTEIPYDIFTCTLCSDSYTVNGKPADGHRYVQAVIAPTCTQFGYTLASCSVCGESTALDFTAPVGHKLGIRNKTGSCATHGTIEYVCVHCDYSEIVVAETTDTATELDGAIAAGCGQAGYTGDTVCVACGEVLQKGEIIPALGVHIWDAGTVLVPPDGQSEGEILYTCTVCQASVKKKTEKIPEPDKEIFYGDIDSNGLINSADARTALRAAVGLDLLSEEQAVAADVDGNGAVTSADARSILRYAVGLETDFTVNKEA